MSPGNINYLPVAPSIYAALVLAWMLLIAVIQVRAVQYGYTRLGISPRVALLLLLASLIGSYVNIPVLHLPEREFISGQVISFVGMRYVVPVVVDWPATIVAINVGGALIPTLLSICLLARNGIWANGLIATLLVGALCHALAQPVPGVGIAIPIFVPPIAAAAAGLFLSREHAAAVAFVGGSLGTLVGADLLNLGRIQGLGAPVASIGGAGTFDGIFVSGIVAVLLAGLRRPTWGPRSRAPSFPLLREPVDR